MWRYGLYGGIRDVELFWCRWLATGSLVYLRKGWQFGLGLCGCWEALLGWRLVGVVRDEVLRWMSGMNWGLWVDAKPRLCWGGVGWTEGWWRKFCMHGDCLYLMGQVAWRQWRLVIWWKLGLGRWCMYGSVLLAGSWWRSVWMKLKRSLWTGRLKSWNGERQEGNEDVQGWRMYGFVVYWVLRRQWIGDVVGRWTRAMEGRLCYVMNVVVQRMVKAIVAVKVV